VGKIPTFDEMMWPTLQALKETGGSASNQELLTRAVQIMALPVYGEQEGSLQLTLRKIPAEIPTYMKIRYPKTARCER